MKKKCLSLTIVVTALLVLGVVTSGYATLVYSDWVLFPKSTTPIPSGITATFTTVDTGHVTLAMTIAAEVNPSIKIDQWGFNYGGLATGETLTATWASGAIQETDIYTTRDQQTKADGDGFYNLYFYFLDSDSGALSAGMTVVYDIYGTGLTENSFVFKSAQHADGTSNGTYSGYYSAIHALALSPTNQGSWGGATTYNNIPIPAAGWLLASGLIGLVVIRRRMEKKSSLSECGKGILINGQRKARRGGGMSFRVFFP